MSEDGMILTDEQNQRMIALRAAAETMSSKGSMISGLGSRTGPPTVLPGDLVRMANWIVTGDWVFVVGKNSALDREKKSGWVVATMYEDAARDLLGMRPAVPPIQEMFEYEMSRVEAVPPDWPDTVEEWEALSEQQRRAWHSKWRDDHLEHPSMPDHFEPGRTDRQDVWNGLTYDQKVSIIRPFSLGIPSEDSDGNVIPADAPLDHPEHFPDDYVDTRTFEDPPASSGVERETPR